MASTGISNMMVCSQGPRTRREVDVLLVELEQAQEVDEVALDEAHRAHVVQLGFGKAQFAQLADLVADLVHVRRQLHAGRPALELVFDLRARKLVQHRLHHGELVQVGVEQALNDAGHVCLNRYSARSSRRALSGQCNDIVIAQGGGLASALCRPLHRLWRGAYAVSAHAWRVRYLLFNR
jgi:hypothetical protein